jgi:hypothetical protein
MFILALLAAGCNLIPSFASAQRISQQTKARISLPSGIRNRDPQRWSDWIPASEGDLPWRSEQLWEGFIKTTPRGKKASFQVGFFLPTYKLKPGEMTGIVTSGFGMAGADNTGSEALSLSDYPAEELTFQSADGNGLFFADPKIGIPTTGSIVVVEMEKEPGRDIYPFLVLFLAAPSADFGDIKPEFDEFVRSVVIKSLPASISGRVTDAKSGAGIPGARLQLFKTRTAKPIESTAGLDGTYRFDSLTPGIYDLAAADNPGYLRPLLPMTVSLTSGQDTTDINLTLEPEPLAAAPVASTKQPRPGSETDVIPHFRFGLGYRHRLDDNWGLALNARVWNVVADVSFGCNFWQEDSHSDNRLFASAGLSYFFLNEDNAHLGAGVVGTGWWLNDTDRKFSLQFPLTVEYFPTSQFSVQLSTGVVRTCGRDSVNWMIGPANPLGSCGFTWYLW